MTLRRTGLGLATVDENSTFKEVETAITDNATVTDDLLAQVIPDVEALKKLGGLAPGDLSDATMTVLASDPDSNFSAALATAQAENITTPGTLVNTALNATTAEIIEESPVVAAKQPKERALNAIKREFGGPLVRHNLPASQAAWADEHITIFKSGKKYAHAFDCGVYKATGGNTIYADPVNGNDSTGTGSSVSPVKALWRAHELVTTGGTIILKDGFYYRNTAGWAAILLGEKSVNIIAQNPGKVALGSFDTLTWTATAGQTRVYQATRSNTLRFVDILAGQDGYEYEKLATVAEVAARPGSWCIEANTTVYVNTLNGTIPSNVRHLAILSSQALTLKADTAPVVLYIEGIDVIGGQDGNVLIDAVSQQADFYAKDCRFLFPSLTSMNSVSIQGGRRAFFQNCVAFGSLKDGPNYTSWNTGSGRNRQPLAEGSSQINEPRYLEVDCHFYGHGLGTGTFAPSIAGVNNASTGHAGAKGIRIGGAYHDTDGAVIADVQPGTESDNFSIIVYGSRAVNPVYNASVSAQQSGAVMRFYDLQAFDSLTSVHAASGTTVTVDGSEIESTGGGGTITVTDPQ